MKSSEGKFGPYYFLFSDFGISCGDPAKNPTALAHKALTLYNAYLFCKSEKLRKLFLESMEHLLESFILKRNFGVWLFNYVSPRAKMYNCRQPWPSALAQGLCISSLVRACNLKSKREYLETARLALNAFKVPTSSGGVLSVDRDDGDWWYEEYAGVSSRPSGVLNGFIIALLGILDFHRLTKDCSIKELFNRGISTLDHHLHDFDAGYPFKLSYYDRRKHLVTIQYHSLHIKLLEILYRVTGEKKFWEYQHRFKEYGNLWEARRGYRLLSRMYYVKSGYNLKESLELLARSIFKEKKFRSYLHTHARRFSYCYSSHQ